MKYKTAIIGGSGYSGAELMRLLSDHPGLNLEVATADSQAGNLVSNLYPHLKSFENFRFRKFDEVKSEIAACELVFCALPHGEAMKILPGLENKVIIDLGGDFRSQDPKVYETWYGHPHSAPVELPKWQYGLTELFRDKIKSANRIANPGCYPTATILALWPLVKESLIEGVITVDAMSGTSGAGRVPSAGLHVSHVLEDVRAYKVTKHQHTPEIEATLSKAANKQVLVSFTPHLVPTVRGIHATCSAQVSKGVSIKDIEKAFNSAYSKEVFINLSKSGPSTYNPGTKDVRGSNAASIAFYLDERLNRVVVTSVIDNLVKGAAGQAIQNANLIFGFEEKTSLSNTALYP